MNASRRMPSEECQRLNANRWMKDTTRLCQSMYNHSMYNRHVAVQFPTDASIQQDRSRRSTWQVKPPSTNPIVDRYAHRGNPKACALVVAVHMRSLFWLKCRTRRAPHVKVKVVESHRTFSNWSLMRRRPMLCTVVWTLEIRRCAKITAILAESIF